MRIQLFLAAIFLRNVFSHPLHWQNTAVLQQLRPDFKLTGLLDGDNDSLVNSYSSQTTLKTLKAFHNLKATSPPADGLGWPPTSEAAKTTSGPTTTAMSTHTNSIISTPEMRDTTTLPITTTSSSTVTSAVSPTVSVGFTKEAPKTPPDEATEWKVIGVAIITICFVATVILAVAFFDSWWGFLRATVVGKKKSGGAEDMVPDWGKKSWEFKLANENGHRYPTLASLESITNGQYVNAQEDMTGNPFSSSPSQNQQYLLPTSPKATYLPDCDPHPFEHPPRRPVRNHR